jgi:CheB methylesterase
MDDQERRFPVVGIGASAGGVEALQAFFRAMPGPAPAMAFVVVTHLGPGHESALPAILGWPAKRCAGCWRRTRSSAASAAGTPRRPGTSPATAARAGTVRTKVLKPTLCWATTVVICAVVPPLVVFFGTALLLTYAAATLG